MLRPIMAPHIRPILLSGQAQVGASTATLLAGGDDFSAITRVSNGRFRVVPYSQPFAWDDTLDVDVAVVATTASTSATAGTALAPSTARILFGAMQGNSEDVPVDFLAYNFWEPTSRQEIGGLLHQVLTTQPGSIMFGGLVDSTGAQSIVSSDYSVTLTGTSQYNITFKNGFGQAPRVIVTPTGTAGIRVKTSVTAEGFTLITQNTSNADTAAGFNFLVLGTKSIEKMGRRLAPLMGTQREQVLLGVITNDGAMLDMGLGSVTSASGGTGIGTVTFTKPFARTPIVVSTLATSSANRSVSISAQSSTSCTIRGYTSAGSAANGIWLTLILGSYDATNF